LLSEQGRFPRRRTWERRVAKLPERLPALMGCFGRSLVAELPPWGCAPRRQPKAAAVASTALRAKGGVWHPKERAAGVVPHSTLATEAHGSKSGYHGWWYGWKLHLATTAAALWIPLAAPVTPANIADQDEAPALVRELHPELRFSLGDTQYNEAKVRLQGAQGTRHVCTSCT